MSSRRFAGMLAGALALAPAANAQASEIKFGAHDIQTTFFISKSDDRNRVDYGMRLDVNCAPSGEEAVFPYWRDLEEAPVRVHDLSLLDRIAFGIGEQRTIARTETGGEYAIRLKQVDRLIEITTKKEPNGSCSALTRSIIGGKKAELVSVFAKLGGIASVDYLDVFGKSLKTGALFTERITR